MVLDLALSDLQYREGGIQDNGRCHGHSIRKAQGLAAIPPQGAS